MLLCAYMPSVSADLLVTRFLFFNLMFWVLCHDVVICIRIKIVWLVLVCTPIPSYGLGALEDLEGGFEGAVLQTAFTALQLRCCGTAQSLSAAEMPPWLQCESILVTLQRSASHVFSVCIRFRI